VIELPGTFGAVEGRIQTVSNRGSLHFVLYDRVNDKAVSCYLKEDQRDWMNAAWDRLAVVQGWVKRDPNTGRPQTIRHIRAIRFLDELPRGAWRQAEGALHGIGRDELPEVTIRRLRDAQ
jgi:hypothetical protein